MIKNIIKIIANKLGYKLVRISKNGNERIISVKEHFNSRDEVINNPLNANCHLQFALDLFNNKRYYLAYAELKTAKFIGISIDEFLKYQESFYRALPDAIYMNHNQYYRFITLATELINRSEKDNLNKITILDVGGGDGQLASFVPDFDYCLAEPISNGISGLELPFENNAFNYVVSCHVLEHIPEKNREEFLDKLMSKAKNGVLLLNPIQVENSWVTERIQLFIELTNAQWAKEHLECSLPTVKFIKNYAIKRNLNYNYSPNGSLTTSMAFVFVDFFAAKADSGEAIKKLNRFFNSKYNNILDNDLYPNAGLFYLGKK